MSAGTRTRRDAVLHVDEEPAATGGTRDAGPAPRGAPQEAPSPTLTRHEAPSRRLHPGVGARLPGDLIVTREDATSDLYSAFFVDEEGTMSSFQGLREVIERTGLFSSLYTDRGTH